MEWACDVSLKEDVWDTVGDHMRAITEKRLDKSQLCALAVDDGAFALVPAHDDVPLLCLMSHCSVMSERRESENCAEGKALYRYYLAPCTIWNSSRSRDFEPR